VTGGKQHEILSHKLLVSRFTKITKLRGIVQTWLVVNPSPPDRSLSQVWPVLILKDFINCFATSMKERERFSSVLHITRDDLIFDVPYIIILYIIILSTLVPKCNLQDQKPLFISQLNPGVELGVSHFATENRHRIGGTQDRYPPTTWWRRGEGRSKWVASTAFRAVDIS
jgi:hypothetical protein